MATIMHRRADEPATGRSGHLLALAYLRSRLVTALAGDDQGAATAFQAQVLDVRTGGLRYPQAVEGKQGDERVLEDRAEAGGDQERAELVAVQGGGVRLMIQPRSADVGGRGVVEEFFLDGVLAEPGDGTQPPGEVARARPRASSSRAKVSMSARRTENSGRDRARHQPANWRRSRV
jgi:hypothetical protein